MRLILHDKALLDLEAPFAANQNADIVAGGTVPGGIGLEDLILSPSIRDCYQVILSTFNHILGRESRVEQIYGRRDARSVEVVHVLTLLCVCMQLRVRAHTSAGKQTL